MKTDRKEIMLEGSKNIQKAAFVAQAMPDEAGLTENSISRSQEFTV